jgi:uncharacterized protein
MSMQREAVSVSYINKKIASGYRPRNDGHGGMTAPPIRHCEALKEPKQSRDLNSLFFTTLYILFSSPLLAHNLTLTCPHKSIPFQVEVAKTPHEQEKGLMFRTHLKEDEGMLFLFSEPKASTMWMKNTPLSLDMIFCNDKGKILAIHENTAPYSLKIIGPVEGTTQVLEILGGTVQKHGITQRCTLNHFF